MKARPKISIAALDAVISKSQPMMNGIVIKSIVWRRPIEFMMNPISGQMRAAPTFKLELSRAHSVIEIVFERCFLWKRFDFTNFLHFESIIVLFHHFQLQVRCPTYIKFIISLACFKGKTPKTSSYPKQSPLKKLPEMLQQDTHELVIVMSLTYN